MVIRYLLVNDLGVDAEPGSGLVVRERVHLRRLTHADIVLAVLSWPELDTSSSKMCTCALNRLYAANPGRQV